MNAPETVLKLVFFAVFIIKDTMNQNNPCKIPSHQQKRLENISKMLYEIRFSEGKTQEGYKDLGITRRQIQRAEYANNLSLVKLFQILDCYEYSLHDFFYDME